MTRSKLLNYPIYIANQSCALYNLEKRITASENGKQLGKVIMDLVGTWELLEWDCSLDGVYHNHPFGREARGRLMYTAEGAMSAILMRPHRPSFSVPNLSKGTAAEKAAALAGYVSYAGSYRVADGRVYHQVEFSLLPNWIGTELVREVAWTDDSPSQLILSTLPEKTRSGKIVVNRLRWARKTTADR